MAKVLQQVFNKAAVCVSNIDKMYGTDKKYIKGWDIFPEYVLALRFAWLSEWLRKKDEEMLELEACYMDILVNNMDILKQIWNI